MKKLLFTAIMLFSIGQGCSLYAGLSFLDRLRLEEKHSKCVPKGFSIKGRTSSFPHKGPAYEQYKKCAQQNNLKPYEVIYDIPSPSQIANYPGRVDLSKLPAAAAQSNQ